MEKVVCFGIVFVLSVILNEDNGIEGRYDFIDVERLDKNNLGDYDLEDVVLRDIEDDVLEVPDSVWEEEANYTANHPYLGSRGIDDDVMIVPDSVWEEEANYTPTNAGGKFALRQYGSNLPAPTGTCLSIKVIYDRNWVNQAGGGSTSGGRNAANSVISQAQAIFNWNSLKCGSSNSACNIQLQLSQQPVYEPSSTWFANSNSLRGSGVRRHIGGSNIDHHVFLGGRDGGGAIGIAWLGTACVRSPRDYSYKTSISEWTGSSDTARTVAHEIGHALRMEHDFDYPNRADRQGRPCTGINSIMDYTRNENKWSPCSTQAFRDFYNRELSTKRFFCMQKSCNGVVPSAVPTIQPQPTPCTDRSGWCSRIANSNNWFAQRFCSGILGERLCKKSCNRC